MKGQEVRRWTAFIQAAERMDLTYTPEQGRLRPELRAGDLLRPRDRALGHATSGPALQQNLVCVMEARP